MLEVWGEQFVRCFIGGKGAGNREGDVISVYYEMCTSPSHKFEGFKCILCFLLILTSLYLSQLEMRNNRKGLLPEPNPVQIMKSFNNPAMLQMLLQPQLRGHAVKPGKWL